MNNFWLHVLDLKAASVALFLGFVSMLSANEIVKLAGGILIFIYYGRRFYIMEKKFKNNKTDGTED